MTGKKTCGMLLAAALAFVVGGGFILLACQNMSSTGGKTWSASDKELKVLSRSPEITPSDVTPEEMAGAGLDGLAPQQKEQALRLLNNLPCDCDCRTMTVAQCRVYLPDCDSGKSQAETLIKKVKDGQAEDKIVREMMSESLGRRLRSNVTALIQSIGKDKSKRFMVAQLARLTMGIDPSGLGVSDDELGDARATARKFLGEDAGIVKYIEGVPNEMYVLHGVTYELLGDPRGALFEYFFFSHRPELQKRVLPYLNEGASDAEMLITLAEDFFAQPPLPSGYDASAGDSPSKGSADAPVLMVEYGDYECPYSRRLQSTIDKVMARFPNKVRHVYKNFPLTFHKNARSAAKAALAAGRQGKFWEMHDLIYKNSRSLSEEKYKEFAEKLGLDMDKFMKDYKSGEIARQVEQDFQEGQKIGVRSTPTVFLNGVMIRGAQSTCTFVETILDELEEK